MCWTVAASLAVGNAAMVKPSEQTPLSTLRFMQHFESPPDSLVACVTGRGETAQALIQSSGTDAVAFTGGVETGRKVASASAEQLKPSVIEAGGNDPMIVTENAPMEVAVAGSATAAFHLSGQVCTSSERLYVHEAVHDQFVDGLVEMATSLRVGNGLGASEIGPLVSEAARDNVARLVDEAVDAGASVACGGRVPPDRETGWFYEPTVLTGVTPGMAVSREEVFGPVAPVCEVASLDEALETANDTAYGLGSSVFTTDLAEAMRSYETLESGMVWVNNPMIDNDAIPFGGGKTRALVVNSGNKGWTRSGRPRWVSLIGTRRNTTGGSYTLSGSTRLARAAVLTPVRTAISVFVDTAVDSYGECTLSTAFSPSRLLVTLGTSVTTASGRRSLIGSTTNAGLFNATAPPMTTTCGAYEWTRFATPIVFSVATCSMTRSASGSLSARLKTSFAVNSSSASSGGSVSMFSRWWSARANRGCFRPSSMLPSGRGARTRRS